MVSYVLSVQERLAKMSELVEELENLKEAQKQQKRGYDSSARTHGFWRQSPGLTTVCYQQAVGELARPLWSDETDARWYL